MANLKVLVVFQNKINRNRCKYLVGNDHYCYQKEAFI